MPGTGGVQITPNTPTPKGGGKPTWLGVAIRVGIGLAVTAVAGWFGKKKLDDYTGDHKADEPSDDQLKEIHAKEKLGLDQANASAKRYAPIDNTLLRDRKLRIIERNCPTGAACVTTVDLSDKPFTFKDIGSASINGQPATVAAVTGETTKAVITTPKGQHGDVEVVTKRTGAKYTVTVP